VNLEVIDPNLRPGEARCRVIIETPKGSRSKYTYDPELGIFELAGVLPAGMGFPLDFGFVPGTLAEDGYPLDVLVIGDEPSAIGCVVEVRILGVIKAVQTEKGDTVRNDRLIARVEKPITYGHATDLAGLGDAFVEHLGQFFCNYNTLKGKGFRVLEVAGRDAAIDLIRQAIKAQRPSPNVSVMRGH